MYGLDTHLDRLNERQAPSIVPDDLPNTPWLQTLHPAQALRRFDLVNPTAYMVDFRTMALVLARIPRFNGHTTGGVYSVAQHSVEGARVMRRAGHQEAARAFLLHDAHEYIMGDMATPIQEALKTHAEMASGNVYAGETIGKAVTSLKQTLDRVIYEAAGIEWPLSKAVRLLVKEYDARMCNVEHKARMETSPAPWVLFDDLEPVEGVDLSRWAEDTARLCFWNECRAMLPALRV